MYTLLVGIAVAVIVALPGFFLYIKERKSRCKSEKILTIVRQIGEIDDQIFRMRISDPEGWSRSRGVQMLIVNRIRLHEEYSLFLGHQLLRDCEYTSELMRSVISK